MCRQSPTSKFASQIAISTWELHIRHNLKFSVALLGAWGQSFSLVQALKLSSNTIDEQKSVFLHVPPEPDKQICLSNCHFYMKTAHTTYFEVFSGFIRCMGDNLSHWCKLWNWVPTPSTSKRVSFCMCRQSPTSKFASQIAIPTWKLHIGHNLNFSLASLGVWGYSFSLVQVLKLSSNTIYLQKTVFLHVPPERDKQICLSNCHSNLKTAHRI